MARPENEVLAPPPPPEFSFTFDPSVEPWNLSAKEWLRIHDKHWNGLATGAMVFDSAGRILLLQRAAHDSMPNRWETPGGAVDAEDPTVLHACARELWEETGLVCMLVKRVVPPSGQRPDQGAVFTNRTGVRSYCRFSFEVDVPSVAEVKLDPNEHQDFVWATEEEVRAERIGERQIPITNALMKGGILEALRLRRDAASNDFANLT